MAFRSGFAEQFGAAPPAPLRAGPSRRGKQRTQDSTSTAPFAPPAQAQAPDYRDFDFGGAGSELPGGLVPNTQISFSPLNPAEDGSFTRFRDRSGATANQQLEDLRLRREALERTDFRTREDLNIAEGLGLEAIDVDFESRGMGISGRRLRDRGRFWQQNMLTRGRLTEDLKLDMDAIERERAEIEEQRQSSAAYAAQVNAQRQEAARINRIAGETNLGLVPSFGTTPRTSATPPVAQVRTRKPTRLNPQLNFLG